MSSTVNLPNRHIAKKRFGQNFLCDGFIIQAIVEAINPLPGQRLVEIGPGLMALTQPLLAHAQTLCVIELDRDLAQRMEAVAGLQVLQQDVLQVNFAELAGEQKLRVVGNLPYNISTPILFHLLDFASHIKDQHFMLQKEVVDRMVAKPGTAAYGRLSVMLQWRYAMENLLAVPPESFTPAPKVDSAVVRMLVREQPEPLDSAVLSEIVKVAFSQRRKILRHTLAKWLDEKGYTGVFDVQRRAEELSVSEYIQLAQAIQK